MPEKLITSILKKLDKPKLARSPTSDVDSEGADAEDPPANWVRVPQSILRPELEQAPSNLHPVYMYYDTNTGHTASDVGSHSTGI